MAEIKFGTSGWRAIIAEDFTFANVKIAVTAIARQIIENGDALKGLVIAADNRFLSEEFMRTAIQVLAAHEIRSFECPLATPTPTVAFETIRRQAAGSINFTASHNPPTYQGLKFNGPDGGPASPRLTQQLEAKAHDIAASGNATAEISYELARTRGWVIPTDPREPYLARLRELVDLDAIRKARLRIVVDCMHGNGARYLDTLLSEAGTTLRVLHRERDLLFGGHRPDPAAEYLSEAAREVRSWPAHLGLATDGDADRFGVIDADGTFITPNEVLCLTLDHLLRTRSWKGSVVRTVATTHLIDAIAHAHGVAVRETPVGFKYIAEIMKKEPILIGGEESGGLTIHDHVPEKDGILACLLIAELVAHSGKTLRILLDDLAKRYGPFVTDRLDIALKPGDRESLEKRLLGTPPTQIAGKKVNEIVRTDGTKFVLEGGEWLMIRFSGTEPLVRCYLEARSRQRVEILREAAQKIVRQ